VANKLPPIARIVIPDAAKLTSTKIRWLAALGYEPREIHHKLGVRYQQVRNVLTQPPKRMAREDLPPLEIRLFELGDDLEAMDQHAFQEEMAAHRKESNKNRREINRKRRQLAEEHTDEDEVDEITELEGDE
jgi:hypothetical protein